MLRQFVFRIILAAFAFVLVPTNYWHSCEKPHSEHSDHQANIDAPHDICSICDFDLFQLDQVNFITFKTQGPAKPDFFGGKTHPCQSAPQSYFNKGPPATLA